MSLERRILILAVVMAALAAGALRLGISLTSVLTLLVGGMLAASLLSGPVWGIGLLVLAIPFSQLARFLVPPDSPVALLLYMTWEDMVVGVLLFVAVGKLLLGRTHHVQLKGSTAAAVVLVGVGLVYLAQASPLLAGAIGFSEMMTGILLFFAVRLTLFHPLERRAIVRVMLLSLWVLVGGGLLVYLLVPEVRFWELVGVPQRYLLNSYRVIAGIQVPRLSSFVIHPLEMGYIGLIMCCAYVARYAVARRLSIGETLGLGAALLGLLFTFTRSAMIGVAAATLVVGVTVRLPARVLYGIGGLAAVLMSTQLFGSFFRSTVQLQEESAASHFDDLFVQGPEWIQANLWGSGLGNSEEVVARVAAVGGLVTQQGVRFEGIESEYFRIVGSIGIVGLVLYLVFVWLCGRDLHRLARWRHWGEEERWLTLLALGALVGIHVGVAVLPVLNLRTMNFYMWIVTGLALGLSNLPRASSGRSEPAAGTSTTGPASRVDARRNEGGGGGC